MLLPGASNSSLIKEKGGNIKMCGGIRIMYLQVLAANHFAITYCVKSN